MLQQAAVVLPDKLSLFLHHHNIQQLCAENQTAAPVQKLPAEYGKKKEKNVSFSLRENNRHALWFLSVANSLIA